MSNGAYGAYAECPACGKERRTTKSGAIMRHNKFSSSGKNLGVCEGTFQYPRKTSKVH